MTAIRLSRTLDSETLHLPELKPLLGKKVQIVVQEELPPGVTEGTGDWDALRRAAENLRDYDFDAIREMNECEIKDMQERWRRMGVDVPATNVE